MLEVDPHVGFAGLGLRLDAVQIVDLGFLPILLYSLALTVHLIVEPGYFETHLILSEDPETFLLVPYEVALISGCEGLFLSKAIPLVFLPAPRITVPSLFILKSSETILSVDPPLPVVYVPSAGILPHAEHCPDSLLLEACVL